MHQSIVTSVCDSRDMLMKRSVYGDHTSHFSLFPAIFSSSIDGTIYLWTAKIDISMKITFHVLFEWNTKQTVYSLWIPVTGKKATKSPDLEACSSNIDSSVPDSEISAQTFYIIGKGDNNRKVLKRIDVGSPNRGKSMKVTNQRNCCYSFLYLLFIFENRHILTCQRCQATVATAWGTSGREATSTLSLRLNRKH